MPACCIECVQTVPRASKKSYVQKDSQLAPRAGTEVQAEKTATDEQAAYVTAWRVDKTLQLAADISNLCTSLIVLETPSLPPLPSPKKQQRIDMTLKHIGQDVSVVSAHTLFLCVRQSRLAGAIMFSTCPFVRPSVCLSVCLSV